jgi:hypothetical protein
MISTARSDGPCNFHSSRDDSITQKVTRPDRKRLELRIVSRSSTLRHAPLGLFVPPPLSASAPSLTASLNSWKYPHPWFLLLVAQHCNRGQGDRVTKQRLFLLERTSYIMGRPICAVFSSGTFRLIFPADASFAPLTHRLPGREIKVSCTEFTPALTIAKEDHIPTSVKP